MRKRNRFPVLLAVLMALAFSLDQVLGVSLPAGSQGAILGGAIAAIGAVTSIGGKVLGAAQSLGVGGGGGAGQVWNRLQPIKVGELQYPGGAPVDAKFAALLNKAWRSDLSRGQGPKNPDIWGAVANSSAVYEQARRNQGLAGLGGTGSGSLGGVVNTITAPKLAGIPLVILVPLAFVAWRKWG